MKVVFSIGLVSFTMELTFDELLKFLNTVLANYNQFTKQVLDK